jgi:hypothetical protein
MEEVAVRCQCMEVLDMEGSNCSEHRAVQTDIAALKPVQCG